MTGLPAKYARMGFKRGWKAFNAKHKFKRYKTRKMEAVKVARRRRFYGKKRGIGKRGMLGSLTGGTVVKIIMGAGLAALYEVFISPMIPIAQNIKNWVEIAVGIAFALMPRMPTPIKAFGVAIAIVNTYSIIMSYLNNSSGSAANYN